MNVRRWEKSGYHLSFNGRTVWASAKASEASTPGEDKYCMIVAEFPVGATPEGVGDGVVETLTFRKAYRCDVI